MRTYKSNFFLFIFLIGCLNIQAQQQKQNDTLLVKEKLKFTFLNVKTTTTALKFLEIGRAHV